MFTDIHSHVIWGVDDGAETKEETFGLLKAAAADGIKKDAGVRKLRRLCHIPAQYKSGGNRSSFMRFMVCLACALRRL